MRVLHIFHEIKYSGAEIMYANAAPLFHQHGIEMIALSTGKEVGDFADHFRNVGIIVNHRNLPNNKYNPIFLFKYFKKILYYIKEENIDVIHIHRASFFWFFTLTGWLSGKRTIRTVHSVFKHGKFTWLKGYLERLTARKLFGLTFHTIGESVYQNELNYYKNSSVKVNNWVDSKKFYPAISENERLKMRDKLGLPQNKFIIISCGSCTCGKNHHDTIRAFAEIKDQVDCLYIHLGKGQTEQEEKQMAASLNVADRIMFLGNKDNVRDYLIASDVYVMSSKFEGLSGAALEAMACAKPSILYNSPGLRDLVHNNDNGFLVNHAFNEIAEKIIVFIKAPELLQEMGVNAYNHVSENYSMKKGVEGVISLYKGGAANGKAGQ